MTATQQARIEGFRVSLAERGHSLTLNGSGTAFKALVEPVGSVSAPEFGISRETASEAHVHALRSDMGTLPSVGDFLHDATAGARYRVTTIRNQPANPVVVFENCEVST